MPRKSKKLYHEIPEDPALLPYEQQPDAIPVAPKTRDGVMVAVTHTCGHMKQHWVSPGSAANPAEWNVYQCFACQGGK